MSIETAKLLIAEFQESRRNIGSLETQAGAESCQLKVVIKMKSARIVQ